MLFFNIELVSYCEQMYMYFGGHPGLGKVIDDAINRSICGKLGLLCNSRIFHIMYAERDVHGNLNDCSTSPY